MDPLDWMKGFSNEQTYSGIVQNLRKVENNDSLFKKWFNSVTKGVPFPVGKERYVFVIKDSASGANRGYRAIVYGRGVGEKLQEGEMCYLTGGTDKNGVIIGRRLYDPKANIHIEADRVFPCVTTRIASIMIVLMIAYLVYALSHIRLTTFSIMGSQTRGVFSIIVMFVLAAVCLKNRYRMVRMLGLILLALAIYALYPPIVIMIIVFFIIKKLLFR